MRQKFRLANQPPVLIKRPIHKQSAPSQVCIRHSSRRAAVIAVVAVIAQGKVAVLRHRERTIWLRQIFTAQGVSSIRRCRRHYPDETIALGLLAIHIEKWRVNSEPITRYTGQPLNIKWRDRKSTRLNSSHRTISY